LEVLYERLWRFGTVIASPGVEADDLVQEAIVRVLERKQLDEISHLLAYLRKAMLHIASNDRRRHQSRRNAAYRLLASNQAKVDHYPSDLDALLVLPPRSRAILFLAEVEGYTYEEISEMIGGTPTAARKAASRGRKRLRADLSEVAT
jgi:RNA polymerase sigma-70 factor (ECF subfamily)